MAEPVRARRLMIRRAGGCSRSCVVEHGSIRVRRAMIIMASASGTPVRRSPGWSPRTRTPCAR